MQPQGTNLQTFPLGVRDTTSLDTVFSDPDATLFILGVGREDLNPIAAKKVKLKDAVFPLVFELETADLIFPYTKESWAATSSSKDSIAVTCILSAGEKLSTPNSLNLIGFAGKLFIYPLFFFVSHQFITTAFFLITIFILAL